MSIRQAWAANRRKFPIRSAVPSDRDRVERFLAAMDREGLYQRHFGHGQAHNLALLRRIDALDHRSRVAVLALARDGELAGHGEYVAEYGVAEFALMVLPRFRCHGLARRMLQALLDIAAAAGLHRVHGMIQASNARALSVALNCGFQVLPGDDPRVVIVSCEIVAAQPPSELRHDPDRTPLHRCPGSRAPLWTSGG
ncbi:MAG: GNAT family N-acetyltransferase [Burkholderiaceae bacterium]|nr:GNAT family N-acetyltransferase [Sulfuritalea sp.]MCF8175715.1 GNAT family N-acetyltransferase [Burkholderiaceae bacterium]MCF8183568.1 GNAT family N-acetyltransferase [Polynucleobacter sp.]